MSYSLKNNEQGLTLVELMIGIAISLILMGIAVKVFLVQQRVYDTQNQLGDTQQNIRATMDMIVGETKMAGYNPSEITNFYGIPYDNDKLTILADLNSDGDTDDTNENITYSYDATDLQIERDTGGGGQPLADYIQKFTFSYLDENGTSTTTSADIRQVRIKITGRTAEVDPDLKRVDGSGYRYVTLVNSIVPRNLSYAGDDGGVVFTGVIQDFPVFVTICHNPNSDDDDDSSGAATTITINQNDLQAHLGHGDHIGSCNDDDDSDSDD